MNKYNWEPIISEGKKAAFLSKITEIANLLIARKQNSNISSGLFAGELGISLTLFYLSRLKNNQDYYDHAINLMENSVSNFKSIHDDLKYSFSNGLAGLGYTIDHLIRNDFLGDQEQSILEDIDSIIYKPTLKLLKAKDYDYLDKAGGHILYFVNRSENERSRIILEKFVDSLYNSPINDENSTQIFANSKEDKLNLSIAHGIAATVALLSKIYQKGICENKTKQVLEKIANKLISFKGKNNGNSGNNYPNIVFANRNNNYYSKRLAWCAGDLGIGIGLHNAAKALGNNNYTQEAYDIFTAASYRTDMKANLVEDAGFCHGTVGIAHIFLRLYNETKIETYRKASIYWLEKSIEVSFHVDGLAGYKTKYSSNGGAWKNNYSLVTGISAIALVFASSICSFEPYWDEIFLLS